MIELTEQQRAELEKQPPPVEVRAPRRTRSTSCFERMGTSGRERSLGRSMNVQIGTTQPLTSTTRTCH